MYINSFWILSFAAFALATIPPEIQKKMFPHHILPKLASQAIQSTDCKPAVGDLKWLATKPRKNSIAIARRRTNTSSYCQSKLPKRMTQEEDRKWTNGRRLAAGFPIKPQKTRVKKPTRAGFPRQEPSATSRETEGTANLIDSSEGDTSDLGSITYGEDGSGMYSYISGDDGASAPLVLSIDTTAAQNGPTYITTTNGPDAAYSYFGALLAPSYLDPTLGDLPAEPVSYDIGPGSTNTVFFGATTLTAPDTYTFSDSMIQQSYGYVYVVESSIFTVDSDGNLQATWVNADGSTVPLYFGIPYLSYNGSTFPTSYLSGYGDKSAALASLADEWSEYGDEVEYWIQWLNIKFTPSSA